MSYLGSGGQGVVGAIASWLGAAITSVVSIFYTADRTTSTWTADTTSFTVDKG